MVTRGFVGMLCQARGEAVDYGHARYRRAVETFTAARGRVTVYDGMVVRIPPKLPMLVVFSEADGLILAHQIRRFLDTHATAENSSSRTARTSPIGRCTGPSTSAQSKHSWKRTADKGTA